MNRTWSSITAFVAAAATSFSVAGSWPVGDSGPVAGETIDTNTPATYRLPPIEASAYEQPACEASSELPVNAPFVGAETEDSADASGDLQSHMESLPAPPPADSSPEIGLADVGHAAAGGVTLDPGPADPPVDLESTATGPVDAAPAHAHREDSHHNQSTPIVPDSVLATPYAPTTVELTEQMLPSVQRGFGLARRGALFAARSEFIQVLRRIAQAHDAAGHTTSHSEALANGLRAIDEAEDFVPDGVQLEGELNVRAIASSHRTNVLPAKPAEVSPFEAVALYHSYAQQQLRESVAGEQSGSMTLHGLGIVHAQLAERQDNDVQLTRSAMTMYSAALDVCPNNYLAANELGVLVCRAGRANEAVALFQQAIDHAPSAVAYHNLAMAQQRLGQTGMAAANERESQRLSALERSRGQVSQSAGVHWVTADEMARASHPIDRHTEPPAGEPVPQPASKSPWQRVVDTTRSLGPSGKAKEDLGPMQPPRVAQPVGKQPSWR